MLTATRKHLSVVRGLAQFASVTVGRSETHGIQVAPLEPEILLNEHVVRAITEAERELVEAARRGVRQAEVDLGWQGPQHYVLKIEGLEVDGISADAACLAALEATKALIDK